MEKAQAELGSHQQTVEYSLTSMRTDCVAELNTTVATATAFSQAQAAANSSYSSGPLQGMLLHACNSHHQQALPCFVALTRLCFVEVLASVSAQLESQQELVRAMVSAFHTALHGMDSQVASFASGMATQLTAMETNFRSGLSEQQAAVVSAQTKLHAQRDAAQQQLQDNVAGIKASMSSMLDSWLQQQVAQQTQDNQAVTDTCQALTAATTSLQAEASATLEQALDSTAAFQTTVSQGVSSTAVATTQAHDQVAAVNLDTQQQMHAVGEHVARHVDSQAAAGTVFQAEMQQAQASFDEHSLATMQTAIVTATQGVGQVTQTVLPLATQASELQQASAAFASNTKCEIQNLLLSMSGHVTESNTKLTTIVDTLSGFLQKDLRQDMPTGTTPARQAYRFPRGADLVATEPRDVLLQQFEQVRQQSLMEIVDEETGEEVAMDTSAAEDTEMAAKGESSQTMTPLQENSSSGIPMAKTRGSVRRGQALNTVN